MPDSYSSPLSKAHPKLAKFLAHAGVASRRAAEELILAGKVSVNDTVEKNVARRVDPTKDTVKVSGKTVGSTQKRVLLSYYKPVGVVSTTSDPDGKPTVLDQLPSEWKSARLYPVGRLDEESEGLLLLTNDGDFAYKLTHPKFQIKRTYRVWINGVLSDTELYRLRDGVPLKDGITQAAEVTVVEELQNGQVIEITLTEGRHHQIRRMMQAMNHEVKRLLRLSHGKYALQSLKPGEWREEN